MKFHKVDTTDYYGEFEDVKGFHHGDKIKVKWPDSTISSEILVVEMGTGSAQVDMNGYPDHFPTQRYYVVHNIKGKTVKVSLKGMMIGK